YQQSGQIAAAAAELTRVSEQEGDTPVRREALYSAAELYQNAGDSGSAIARYQRYVQAYPQPMAQAMEARFQLGELHKQLGDSDGRRQWLRQIVDADAGAGAARSERSRFLAAQAQDELAEELYREI